MYALLIARDHAIGTLRPGTSTDHSTHGVLVANSTVHAFSAKTTVKQRHCHELRMTTIKVAHKASKYHNCRFFCLKAVRVSHSPDSVGERVKRHGVRDDSGDTLNSRGDMQSHTTRASEDNQTEPAHFREHNFFFGVRRFLFFL